MTSTRIRALAIVGAVGAAATLVPNQADAQGRRGGHVVRGHGNVVVAGYYRPVFYDPFFYDPWFYPYRYGWYPPYPYYGYAPFYDGGSSLRVQVSPRETEVFIDGYYAGTVDDFDGFFQRLRLERGEHEVTLYLAGHRTVTQKIFLQPGGTFRIRHTMETLPAGAPPEPRPVPPAAPPPGTQGPQGPGGPQSARPAPRGDTTFGAIAIRVQPADAEVFIDGERWEGPADDEALIVQIAPGGHTIEVRKEGYRSYTAQLDVRAGETTPINISLPRQ